MIYNRFLGKISLVLFILSVFLLGSCVKSSTLTSFKNKDKKNQITYNLDTVVQYKILVGDKIGLQVVNNAGAEIDIFNKQLTQQNNNNPTNSQAQMQGYDVDEDGFIDVPMIGKVHAEGKSIQEVDSLIENQLKEYITFVYVKTVLLSYRITVLGEVKAPQVFNNTFAEINIMQAIGMSGDFTDYANRKRVKVYRKTSVGDYEMLVVNLADDSFLAGTRFQLKPNDVIYVEPLKMKSVKVNMPTISVGLSVITLAFVVLSFLQ